MSDERRERWAAALQPTERFRAGDGMLGLALRTAEELADVALDLAAEDQAALARRASEHAEQLIRERDKAEAERDGARDYAAHRLRAVLDPSQPTEDRPVTPRGRISP